MSAHVSTRTFHFQKETRTMVSEVSDLPNKQIPFTRVFEDACDVGFWLVSHKTGKEYLVYLNHVDEDANGEDLYGWRFRPVDKTAPFHEVLIIND